MAYEYDKQTWVDGETHIDADHMNHIEEGVHNSVTKDSLDGSGVEGKSYTVIQDTITVETAEDGVYPYPVCQVASGNDILVERWKYFRVTINDDVYILQEKMWYIEYASGSSSIVKGLGFLGNLNLYGRDVADGYYLQIDDVPFLITSTSIDGQSEGIWLITEEAGTYTIKIERIEYDQTDIPDHLVYGDGKNHPIDLYVEAGYDSYNIGWNRYPSPKRGNIGIGVGNVISGNFNKAFGQYNHVHGQHGFAFGQKNDVSAQYAYAFGLLNVVSGLYGTAIGISNTASGQGAVADGYKAVASGKFACSRGHETIANHKAQTVIGEYNEADQSEAAADERGNYLEIVGNGTDAENRSNARTLDWNGNESLAGSITLGKGTADEVTMTAAQLKQLLATL